MQSIAQRGRWCTALRKHRDLPNDLVQAHLDLLEAIKPRVMGGSKDTDADSALRRMRDLVNLLCDAVELSEEPVVFCCSIGPNTE